MRTMKDKERFFIITKIFLHMNGPSTSKEISDYVKTCPVKMQKDFNPIRVATLLRGQEWAKRLEEGKTLRWKVKV